MNEKPGVGVEDVISTPSGLVFNKKSLMAIKAGKTR